MLPPSPPNEPLKEERPLVNPLYAVFNEATQKFDRRIDKSTGKPLWPWPQLYYKDRVGMSDRMYEVAKDGSFRTLFIFTKKLRKQLQRERNANAQGSTPVLTAGDPSVLPVTENLHSECD